MGELFEGLERFGLVTWHGRDRSTQAGSGIEYSSGGEIELTPLGRHVFPDIVRQAGYTFDEVEGIEDASAQQMVRVALAVRAQWRRGARAVADRSGPGQPARTGRWLCDPR